jgi:thiamine-phosphate diphosphorylase
MWLKNPHTRLEGIEAHLATYFVVGPQDVAGIAGRDLLDTIREAIVGGITFLQLRAKPAGAREILELARAITPLLAAVPEEKRPLFVIDDRVDVAAAAQREGLVMDGVHVGQSDLPVEHAAQLLAPGSVIGLSAATPETVTALDAQRADYLGVGAYHGTISKADAGAGIGAQKFAELTAAAVRPVVAIGGVGPADALDVARAGGAGLCVISNIARAEDVRGAAETLATAWKDAVAQVARSPHVVQESQPGQAAQK